MFPKAYLLSQPNARANVLDKVRGRQIKGLHDVMTWINLTNAVRKLLIQTASNIKLAWLVEQALHLRDPPSPAKPPRFCKLPKKIMNFRKNISVERRYCKSVRACCVIPLSVPVLLTACELSHVLLPSLQSLRSKTTGPCKYLEHQQISSAQGSMVYTLKEVDSTKIRVLWHLGMKLQYC